MVRRREAAFANHHAGFMGQQCPVEGKIDAPKIGKAQRAQELQRVAAAASEVDDGDGAVHRGQYFPDHGVIPVLLRGRMQGEAVELEGVYIFADFAPVFEYGYPFRSRRKAEIVWRISNR